MRAATIASVFAASLLALGACGPTTETQAATGGAAGALVGGIPGAVVGAGVGALAGDQIQGTARRATQ